MKRRNGWRPLIIMPRTRADRIERILLMAKKLTRLRIDEISSVDKGAGENCRIVLMKRDAPLRNKFTAIFEKAFQEGDDDRDRGDAAAKIEQMVAELIRRHPS